MSHYIKLMADELSQHLYPNFTNEGIASRFYSLIEEIDRLDPRDFPPASRFEFMSLRRKLRNYRGLSDDDWSVIGKVQNGPHPRGTSGFMLSLLRRVEMADLHGDWAEHPNDAGCKTMAQNLVKDTGTLLAEMSAALESYLGADARGKVRAFPYIRDVDLRKIVERDYHELMVKLFPTESWKSVVIIAGSILEALLYDLLTRDGARVAAAMAAKAAPKTNSRGKGTLTKDILSGSREDEWNLNNLIEVADQLSLLPKDWKARLCRKTAIAS